MAYQTLAWDQANLLGYEYTTHLSAPVVGGRHISMWRLKFSPPDDAMDPEQSTRHSKPFLSALGSL